MRTESPDLVSIEVQYIYPTLLSSKCNKPFVYMNGAGRFALQNFGYAVSKSLILQFWLFIVFIGIFLLILFIVVWFVTFSSLRFSRCEYHYSSIALLAQNYAS